MKKKILLVISIVVLAVSACAIFIALFISAQRTH